MTTTLGFSLFSPLQVTVCSPAIALVCESLLAGIEIDNNSERSILSVALPVPEPTFEMKRIVTLPSAEVMPGMEEKVVIVRGWAEEKSSPNSSRPERLGDTRSCS